MLVAGKPQELRLDMAPPAGGWHTDARLRIQTRDPAVDSPWRVLFNGVALEASPDVSEPYAAPYPDGLGTPDTLRAWIVPRPLLKDGPNRLRLELVRGKAAAVRFIDLAVR